MGCSLSHFPKSAIGLFQQALNLVQSIESAYCPKNTLNIIVSHLPRSAIGLFQQALNIAQSLEEESQKVQALDAILSCLPESAADKSVTDLLQRASDITQSMGDSIDKAKVLRLLASHLPNPQQREVLQQALKIAQSSEAVSFSAKAEVITLIALDLPKSEQYELLEQVIQNIQAIQDARDKYLFFCEIIPHLCDFPPGFVEEALQTGRSLEEERGHKKIRLFGLLIPKLSEPLKNDFLQELLKTIQSIEGAESQALAISLITPCVSEQATEFIH